MTGVEGTAMSRARSARPDRPPARLHREREGARHADRTLGLSHGGVDEHRIEAELHRSGGVRGGADPGIDDQRYLGKRARSALRPNTLFSPRPDPIGAAHGINTRQPAFNSRSATTRSSVQ